VREASPSGKQVLWHQASRFGFGVTRTPFGYFTLKYERAPYQKNMAMKFAGPVTRKNLTGSKLAG
jgi:hypothetical protein